MTLEQKYQALLRINAQLLEFASCHPEWHRQLHGNKELNESIQLCKRLVSETSYQLQLEEAERLELYFAGDSIALHNME
jgi:hypothetical protein